MMHALSRGGLTSPRYLLFICFSFCFISFSSHGESVKEPSTEAANANRNSESSSTSTHQNLPSSQPLWEFGLGLGYASIPGYIGSSRQSNFILPLPVLYYHGDKLKVSRQAIRADLLNNENWEIRLSVSGYPPVDSDDNPEREGMDDLDVVFEAGPSVIYRDTFGDYDFSLELPVRFAFSADIERVADRGFVSSPKIRFSRQYNFENSRSLRWKLTLGADYAAGRYLDYYYSVDPEFATANRPAFQAHGGLGGYYISLSNFYRVRDWNIGVFGRYYDLADAANKNSPLIEQDSANFFGLVVYKFLLSGGQRNSRSSAYEDDL